MPMPMQGTYDRLLRGVGCTSDSQRTNSLATTVAEPGRSNSAGPASLCEKEVPHNPFNEKENVVVHTTISEVPLTPSDTESPSASKVNWPTLLQSSTLYSLPATFSRLWKGDIDHEPTWKPSLFQIRPLAGIVAILIALCSIFASLAILIASDHQPITDWTIPPTVYLAIVAAIANSALHLARSQAIPVSWWYQASRGGSIRVLERQWEVSQSLVRALLHSRHMSLLTIACISTSFVIIDGPLLQRASTVMSTTTHSSVTLNLVLPPELPKGFSGFIENRQIWFSKAFWQSSQEWIKNTPIPLDAPGCHGTCQATVQGPAVTKRHCTSKTWPITPAMLTSMNATWGHWKGYSVVEGQKRTSNPGFYVNLHIDRANPTALPYQVAKLTVGLVSWYNMHGSYVETSCDLVSAIGEYDVRLKDGIIEFEGSQDQGRVVRLAQNSPSISYTEPGKPLPDTLDAITQFLATFVNANASVAFTPGAPTYAADPTTFNGEVARHQNFSSTGNLVNFNFVDPTPDIINKYNELMFRGVLWTVSPSGLPINLRGNSTNKELYDDGVSVNQTVIAQQSKPQAVFHTDLRWYAGAAALEVLTALLILPMFWGWWTLGQDLTLSPFGIALAFDSPLLSDVNSGSGAKGVAREMGDVQVKFGLVGKIHSDVGEAASSGSLATGRLGIAESADVVRPRKGMRFKI